MEKIFPFLRLDKPSGSIQIFFLDRTGSFRFLFEDISPNTRSPLLPRSKRITVGPLPTLCFFRQGLNLTFGSVILSSFPTALRDSSPCPFSVKGNRGTPFSCLFHVDTRPAPYFAG